MRCAGARRVAAASVVATLALGVLAACAVPQADGAARTTRLGGGAARIADSAWLVELLERTCASDPALAGLADDPAGARLQVLVTIVEGSGPRALIERHGYRVDAEYVYPASAIKTCAAVAAYIECERSGVALDAALAFHPLFDDEVFEASDETNLATGLITPRHELRKLFLVSDNRAFNRLYEFVGHRGVNECMWAAGLDAVRVQHRLAEFRSPEDQRRTPRIDLVADSGASTTPLVPMRTSDLKFDNSDLVGIDVGRAHVDGSGELRDEPLQFLQKSWISLVDLQDLNVLLVRPELAPKLGGERRAFPLSPAARSEIVDTMAELPSESTDPRYSIEAYPRDWGKFLAPGLAQVVPLERLRICNKVGRAYGFSVENAYIEDRATGRALFVTAVLQTNANGVLNDGVYEYAEVADPFMRALGAELARSVLLDASRDDR